MHDLLGNPIFWIFGGGTIIAVVAILSDLAVKLLKVRERERAARLRTDAQSEAELFGWVTIDEFERLRSRVDALEAQIGGHPGGVKRVRTLERTEESSEVEEELMS